MTPARVPLVLIGCLASIAVLAAGCGDSSSSSASASSGTTSAGTTSADTTSAGATSDAGTGTATETGTGTATGTATGTGPDQPTTDTTATASSSGSASSSGTDGLTTDTAATASTSSTSGTSGGPIECGNGVLEADEECDDGNLLDGDGCESNCQIGPVLCGNDVIDPGEACDDGNSDPNDGCGASCATECGYLCLAAGEPCIPGFHAVQCASAGAPFGQPSPLANVCQLATLSVDGSHIALSPGTTIAGEPRHLDAMYTDPSNAVFGFAGNTEDIAAGSRLVAVNTVSGELTPIGPSLGVWVMGAAMNDEGELWVTVFDTYERNANTDVRIAQVNPLSGEFLAGPTVLTEGGAPVSVWSTHVSDVAFRFDGAMFISANEPGPPPPEPRSRYLEVDRAAAKVLSAVAGPNDIYAAGMVFVGDAGRIIGMDIRGVDDIFILDLTAPPTLNPLLLYPDPIQTNSGTADLAGCSKLEPQ